MDEMDFETQVSERLEAAKERNMQTIKDNVGLNKKDKVEGETEIKGLDTLKAAIAKKTFHGKLAKPAKEVSVQAKETYVEKVERLQETYVE